MCLASPSGPRHQWPLSTSEDMVMVPAKWHWPWTFTHSGGIYPLASPRGHVTSLLRSYALFFCSTFALFHGCPGLGHHWRDAFENFHVADNIQESLTALPTQSCRSFQCHLCYHSPNETQDWVRSVSSWESCSLKGPWIWNADQLHNPETETEANSCLTASQQLTASFILIMRWCLISKAQSKTFHLCYESFTKGTTGPTCAVGVGSTSPIGGWSGGTWVRSHGLGPWARLNAGCWVHEPWG